MNLRTDARGVFWRLSNMRQAPHLCDAPGNKVPACVCLVAVLLLWAPLWAAAYQAAGMACCNGAMCPLHGRMPKKNSHEGGPAKESPATCDHRAANAAMDCTIACCHPADQSVTPAILFVLPTPPVISDPLLTGDSTLVLSSSRTSPVLDPASPPPRTLPFHQ